MSNKADERPLAIVTGSAGFVAGSLIPVLRSSFRVVGVDRNESPLTTHVGAISEFWYSGRDAVEDAVVVHLAAARFDYGAAALDYFHENVRETEIFLSNLRPKSVTCLVHVSSVAAFDGENIAFNKTLSCDDAYRATKYLQEERVRSWAVKNDVPLYVLYPSAIFDEEKRSDTNIGKLQKIVSYLPFIPLIRARKSLTHLPSFACFILDCLVSDIAPGRYMVVERPVLSVTETLNVLSRRGLVSIEIPALRVMLTIIAWMLWFVGLGGKFDMKLTPNRVKKLFSDTDFEDYPVGVDPDRYNRDRKTSIDILKSLGDQSLE